ncbi:hypothetical protein FRC04_003102 [Tulasnella sp. 424]|nr:hypothetical protein FRC04_003102 [Tulasnella sp. 424]KAG8981106.1 hypothetical protein FRC05_004006 [Tulasnella sp. 425]
MSNAKFEKAVAIVQGLPKDGPVQLSNDDKLKFYKYYKQATVGDVNTTRPGLMDFTGKAKWDAWDSLKGTSQEKAKEEYVELLVATLTKGGDAESQKLLNELNAVA